MRSTCEKGPIKQAIGINVCPVFETYETFVRCLRCGPTLWAQLKQHQTKIWKLCSSEQEIDKWLFIIPLQFKVSGTPVCHRSFLVFSPSISLSWPLHLSTIVTKKKKNYRSPYIFIHAQDFNQRSIQETLSG